jgi:cysteine desulfurase/selenocysteine lyase
MSEALKQDLPEEGATHRLPGANRAAAYDVERIRADFPILTREVYGKPLVYLDNGASAQKPQAVLDAMDEAYSRYYSNVHRGIHRLSQEATDAFEAARGKVARFIGCRNEDEIVFTRGATEAINLVATSWGQRNLGPGDEILLTVLEHHANIVPWQMLRERTGCEIKVVPLTPDGSPDMEAYERLLGPKTKLVAVAHISNVLGTVLPVRQMADKAHAVGAKVLLDGCQAAPHMPIDMQATGCDFYVFSAHKLYGPTGIGVLWAPFDLLSEMPPYQGGGEMIDRVTFEETTFKEPPHRFEAGTPAIVEAVGLGAAIDYVQEIGLDAIAAHEESLLRYATERLTAIEGLTLYGTAREKAAILAFNLAGPHAHDVGTILDRSGVAVRCGHHCAQPLMDYLDVPATSRASFGLYNTHAEVDALAQAIEKVKDFF